MEKQVERAGLKYKPIDKLEEYSFYELSSMGAPNLKIDNRTYQNASSDEIAAEEIVTEESGKPKRIVQRFYNEADSKKPNYFQYDENGDLQRIGFCNYNYLRQLEGPATFYARD